MNEYSIFYEQWKESRNMIIFFPSLAKVGKLTGKKSFVPGVAFGLFVYFFPFPPGTGGGEGMGSNNFHNL